MRKMRKRRRRSWMSLAEGGRLLESAYFSGGILSILGGFLKIWVSFDGFLGSIFPFLAFFGVRETVYSHGAGEHVL
jgi:hypothetical protein